MSSVQLKKIPKKNYIILGVVILVTILILYYFYLWVDVYKDSKLNIPIMDKYMNVINYNELENYVVENPNAIVYVSVLEDENIREFEKKFKNKYKNKDIEKEILYLNITDDIGKKNIVNDMINNYSINGLSIKDVPSILVFDNGELNSIYSISDNDYDVDKLVVYINGLLLESDDM